MEYKEILKLRKMLAAFRIPHEWERLYDGYHIGYPTLRHGVCSVIEHEYSYGGKDDKLEISGLLTPKERTMDTVCGGLTAEEVFHRIMQDYGKQ